MDYGAVLVSYVSSQKGEFIIIYSYVCLMGEESILQVHNFSVRIITSNDKSKCKKHSFEASKVVVKLSNVIS